MMQVPTSVSPWTRAEQHAIREDVAEHGADAERGEQPAGDARVGVEARDDQHRDADEERRPRGVAEQEQRHPEPQQRLADEEAEAALGRRRPRPWRSAARAAARRRARSAAETT